MSLDFALKDFFRKKSQTYPYVLTIILIIALAVFFIYFSISFGLNVFVLNRSRESYKNKYYFSGAINLVYSQFITLILALVFILAFIVVIVISTTLIIHKKRDIAIMKALGTLPRKLYSFYLLEVYIISCSRREYPY